MKIPVTFDCGSTARSFLSVNGEQKVATMISLFHEKSFLSSKQLDGALPEHFKALSEHKLAIIYNQIIYIPKIDAFDAKIKFFRAFLLLREKYNAEGSEAKLSLFEIVSHFGGLEANFQILHLSKNEKKISKKISALNKPACLDGIKTLRWQYATLRLSSFVYMYFIHTYFKATAYLWQCWRLSTQYLKI